MLHNNSEKNVYNARQQFNWLSYEQDLAYGYANTFKKSNPGNQHVSTGIKWVSWFKVIWYEYIKIKFRFENQSIGPTLLLKVGHLRNDNNTNQ
jgi:hypothetical protein